MNELNKTPKEIVKELDQYIVGQQAAKKSVAVALRNRYRRLQLEENMQQLLVVSQKLSMRLL